MILFEKTYYCQDNFFTKLRIMAEVYILLGGNVGDKRKIFEGTIYLIGEMIGAVLKSSSLYETEPWGFTSDLFWNQALIVETSLLPEETLEQALTIEKLMGRAKGPKRYEARTMDIDLIFYGDLRLNTPRLILPHPRMAVRRFVLAPLDEIAPDKCHPVIGLSIKEMLKLCTDPLKVWKTGQK